MRKTIAITGASGFIGTALVRRLLARGETVRVLSRRGPAMRSAFGADDNIEIFEGDLLDPACRLDGFVTEVDVLYNCAGEIRDPARMQALHVGGTKRLLAEATGQIAHWVQLSSVGAYGRRDAGIVTEQTPTAPVGPYEISKTIADEAVAAAADAGGFACTIVRPSNVIGPTMSNRSVFQLIGAIRHGRFVFIGPPGAIANYIHVDNVIEALLLAGDQRPLQVAIYNISDACTFEQLVHDVCDALQCATPKLRLPRWSADLAASLFGRVPGFPLTPSRVQALTTRATYATRKIESDLDYAPLVPMREAITQMAHAWTRHDRAQ